MLTDMLDAPVAELAVGNDIDAGEHLVDAGTLTLVNRGRETINSAFTHLVFFKTVLKDVLYDQTTRLAQCDFMPHAS